MNIARRRQTQKLNLIPILDSVFIFIFFLLMSAQFIDLYEIGSDVPITQSIPAKQDDKRALNLTLEVTKNSILVKKGLEGRRIEKIIKESGQYDLEKLKRVLINVKSQYQTDNQIILRPNREIAYEEIVQIMDVVRSKNTDQKDGKSQRLFKKIIFDAQGN